MLDLLQLDKKKIIAVIFFKLICIFYAKIVEWIGCREKKLVVVVCDNLLMYSLNSSATFQLL